MVFFAKMHSEEAQMSLGSQVLIRNQAAKWLTDDPSCKKLMKNLLELSTCPHRSHGDPGSIHMGFPELALK